MLYQSIIAAVGCFIAIVLLGYFSYHTAQKAMLHTIQQDLLAVVSSAALLTDGDAHEQITTPAQKGGELYRRVQSPYRNLLQGNKDLAYIYTLIDIQNKIYLVIDTQIPKEGMRDDTAAVREEYTGASPMLKEAMLTQSARVEDRPYTDKWGTFLSAYAPLYNGRKEFIGLVGADIRMDDYDARTRTISHAFLLLTGLGMAISCFIGMLIYHNGHSPSRAIREHEDAALQTAQDYSLIRDDLQEAMILQNILLPNEELLDTLRQSQGIDIAHYYHPNAELCGDYVATHKLADNRMLLAMADVSGHGVTAALYTFVLHTLLENLLPQQLAAGEFLERMNQKLYSLLPTGKFATFILVILDVEHSTLEYAAAAAPPPVLISQGRSTMLDTQGMLLGVDQYSTYPTHTCAFHQGDVLCFYSDALIETPNTQGECLTGDTLAHHLALSAGKRANIILKDMVAMFFSECGTSPKDDLSVLVCKRMDKAENI